MSILRSASLMTNVRFLGDRQHGDGRRRCVDAPLGLGRRHALHAMNAALELESGEHAAARNLSDNLLDPPSRPLARRQDVNLPALPLGVFDVHAEQVAGEQSRFVPARARPDLDDRTALVGGVLGQKGDLNALGHDFRFGFDRGKLGFGHGAHVRIEIRLTQQRREVSALVFLGLEGLDRGDHGLELIKLARQCGILRSRRALGEASGDFLVAAEDEIEIVVGAFT